MRVTFDIRFCTTSCSSWTGPGDVNEHGEFEPFRPTTASSDRNPPAQWWISRTSDYGYGLFEGWTDSTTGSHLGKHTDNTHNPNEYHTWVSTYYNPGAGTDLELESWTVDGQTTFTSSYSGATTSQRTATTNLGFFMYGSGVTGYVRNLKVEYWA